MKPKAMNQQALKKWSIVPLVAILAAATAACGDKDATNGSGASSSPSAAATASPGASPSASTAPSATPSPSPKDEGTLTVYLNDFDDIIADMFQKATGYKMQVVVGNGAEIMSRIEAEKGNPHWDVVWADMMPSISALGAKGQLLQGWTPKTIGNLTDVYKKYVPATNDFFPTGAHAAGIIVYNKTKFTAETAPKSWKDFANAQYKNQIATADPAVAAPAYPFVAQIFSKEGMDGGKALFQSWFANGLKVFPKNPQVVEGLNSGAVSVAALQESNAYTMVNAGSPVGLIWPAEGAPASVRVAAIQKNTKNPNAAKAFIEFLLDPKTQQELIDKGEESYFEPSATGAKPKPDRDPNARLVAADAVWAAEHEAEIKQWFGDKAVK